MSNQKELHAMPRSLKTVVTATAVTAALAVSPVVYGQSKPADQKGSHGMMQEGKGTMMGGMMGMMQQMNSMMEACTKMMQGMATAPEAPKKEAPAPKNG